MFKKSLVAFRHWPSGWPSHHRRRLPNRLTARCLCGRPMASRMFLAFSRFAR